MSGRKKLERATRNNRVVAYPTKKVMRDVTDASGKPIIGKDGSVAREEVQLYRFRKMK